MASQQVNQERRRSRHFVTPLRFVRSQPPERRFMHDTHVKLSPDQQCVLSYSSSTTFISDNAPDSRRQSSILSKQRSPSRGGTLASKHERNATPATGCSAISADEDAEFLDEVIMAVTMANRGSVGCAYYLAREETLYFMEDLQFGGTEAVGTLRLFVDPTIVLVPAKCHDEMIDHLRNNETDVETPHEERSRDQACLPYVLECRPSAEFSFESALNKLAGLNVDEPGGASVAFVVPGDALANNNPRNVSTLRRQEILLRLSGRVNLESRLSVGCAGAVLSYVQRRRTAAFLPGDHRATEAFRIRRAEMFTLADTMFITANTLHSLQITATEWHPNVQQHGPAGNKSSSGGAKEGLSIYSLFHTRTKTPQGRVLLRKMFLQPSLNLGVINERLNNISVLLQAENLSFLDSLSIALAKAKNMRTLFANLHKGMSTGVNYGRGASFSVWQTLRYFLFSALQISDILDKIRDGKALAIKTRVTESFHKRRLAEIGRLISEVIDFESSRNQRKIAILPNVDAELDEIKRTYSGIEDMLCHVADHIAGQIPAYLNSKVNVIYFPQIGFLISMAVAEDGVHGIFHGTEMDPWERLFITESYAYYKNSNMNELDQEFGDVYGRICDREIEIVQALTQRVLEHEDLLFTTSDICGELDCIVAFAKTAQVCNFTRPTMTCDNVLRIKGGRHPLQELTVPVFVPNDTYLVGGPGAVVQDEESEHVFVGHGLSSPHFPRVQSTPKGPSVVLLTGPNFSGKSIYLKQVAIITFMAHIGSFVPAESAEVGLTDKIVTRIATRESVSKVVSAFMIDLQQISLSLNTATRRSLVIIDEFGKGTESNDGAGLVAGVFEHLLQRGNECPRVLGATHFHEIFECGFLQPRPALEFGHMETRVELNATDVENQITYLYNYISGRSTSSFGTRCAAINGIATEIVDRAEELVLLASRGEDIVNSCAQMPQAELEELSEAEEIARRFLAMENFELQRSALDNLFKHKASPEL